MPYACYEVQRYDRRTRRVLETLASGLTHESASRLAQTLRADDRANEDAHGYTVATMPLHAQVQHATAAETMAALADGPLTLAA